jgi:inorganic pyrophosphatase
MNEDFWDLLDRLVAESRVVIDRPKGAQHPRYPELTYPLDYGYLEGSRAGDGAGIDVWLGSIGTRDLSAIVLTVDLLKRDAEIKLLLGCSVEDHQVIVNFLNGQFMRATLIIRPTKKESSHESNTRITP